MIKYSCENTRGGKLVKMIKYEIKQKIVTNPEIELPEGSQVVRVRHHDAYEFIADGVRVPECWQVIWLEPKQEVRHAPS